MGATYEDWSLPHVPVLAPTWKQAIDFCLKKLDVIDSTVNSRIYYITYFADGSNRLGVTKGNIRDDVGKFSNMTELLECLIEKCKEKEN